MAETISQADRWLTLDTALGKDAMLATEATGSEAISELFEFRVSALSPKTTIAPEDVLGKPATLSMARPKDQPRIVNGIVTSISAGSVTRGNHRLYTVVISPMLWTLGRTSDYKVFQKKKVPDILGELLAGIKFKNALKGQYEEREYCTQFGETDLAFFHRLIAEEGIFYYFTHSSSDHTLVLCDAATAYADCAQDSIEYRQDAEDVANTVSVFEMGSHLTETSWTLSDYDYEVSTDPSSTTTKTALKPASSKDWEQFRFGDGPKAKVVKALSAAAVDATDAGFTVVEGKGGAGSFTPGHRFTMARHPVDDVAGKKFVLTRVAHESRDPTYFTARPGIEGRPFYRNSFSCIPSDRIARQPLPPPKPVVSGPQTALVVGEKSSIATDDMGRIKVRFYWDREGKKNNKDTCLVRVAQPLAGSGWGAVFIPRGGMEVVVHFLDGDPDRPLVTGAVYNVDNKAPWITKDSATKSGFFTLNVGSTAKSTAHELSFDEKAGEEKLTIHAQKDFLREVENDDTLDVGHDQKRTIKNNRSTTISEGNDELTVSKGNQTLTISQGNQTVTLSQGNQTVKAAAGQITVEAMQGIKLKCGDNVVEITPQGVKINGLTITVTGTTKAETKAPIVNITADGMAALKGGIVNIN
ncbi:MAG: type VI secretion system Vgr family protein [Rhizobiaceae bacterium]